MTSAARPTWLPAVGGGTLRDTGKARLAQLSSRDLVHYTKLKTRQPVPNADNSADSRAELRRRLESAEKSAKGGSGTNSGSMDESEDDTDEDSDEDEDDDEDDTAELMRELAKIKKERAEEKERVDREKREMEEQAREEAMLSGNPLLNLAEGGTSQALATRDFSVKRRWDDDVVFRNQAKGQDERVKKRFINDLLRSDFHRKFMNKYVK
ncbi:Cwf15/Cwc15 cell cycle control protein-domain-containing protein [Chytridium lagenaria]|nr:Cwf15/Cwc15 cell cycle control protein-domain-containing protein [Chytridium lagenaria]